MMPLTPQLPEDVIRFAQAQIAAGHFHSIEDVLRAGVAALEERSQIEKEWLGYAQHAWHHGLASLEKHGEISMNDQEFEAFIDSCLEPSEDEASS